MQHGTSCRCDHELAAVVDGSHWLQTEIDLEGVSIANIHNSEDSSAIFKIHSERFLNPEIAVKSLEGEEHSDGFYAEILMTIPFRSPCRIHDIFFLATSIQRFPSTVTIYANIADLDFASLDEFPAIQTFDVIPDICAQTPHPVKVSKLQNVNVLHLYFKGPKDQVEIDLSYIGIRGIATGYKRKAVNTVYESKPNVADHEVKGASFNPSWNV